MKRFISAMAAVYISLGTAIAGQITMEDKIALQTVMQQEIQESLVDGVIPHVDLATGEITELVPTKAHAMILSIGDNYVLCTDFRDPEGKFVNVDYYLTGKDGKFVVFQTEIDNRAPLKKLVKSGKATMIK